MLVGPEQPILLQYRIIIRPVTAWYAMLPNGNMYLSHCDVVS